MPYRQENDRIPTMAAGVLLVTSIAEFNFVIGPRLTFAVAGSAAWMVVFPAAILVALTVWIAVSLVRMFPGQSLVEIAMEVLGRPLGTLLIGVYTAYWLIRAGELIQVQTFVFSVTLIDETPRAVVAAYIVFISAYLVFQGVEPLSRVALLITPAHIPLVAVTVTAFFTGDFGRLLPLELPSLDAALRGTWAVFSNIPGVEILIMVSPYLSGKGSALKSALVGVAALTVLGVLLEIALLTNFGVVDTRQFLMPTVELSRIARVPGFEGFRLDPVFVVMWFGVTFTAIALIHFMAATAVRGVLRAKNALWPVIGTSVVIVMAGTYPLSAPDLFGGIELLRQWIVPVMSMGLPFALLIAALVRKALVHVRA